MIDKLLIYNLLLICMTKYVIRYFHKNLYFFSGNF